MIYMSFGQLKAVYCTLLAGLIVFCCVLTAKILFQYARSNLVIKQIFQGFFAVIYGLVFVCVINLFNFGKYNISLVVFYLAIIYLLTKSSQKLLDFFSSKVYSIYRIIFRWGKFYFARKVKSLED